MGKSEEKSEVVMMRRWRNEQQDGKWYSFKEGVVPFIYSEDFNLLWGLGEKQWELDERQVGIVSIIKGLKNRPADAGELTIMILWDGQPREQGNAPYDMSRFVGPHDWAIALTWGLYGNNAMQGNHPKVRFIIYDVFGGDTAPNPSFAVKTLFALKKCLPWFYVDTIAGQAQKQALLRDEINRNSADWNDIKGLETVSDILAKTTTTHQNTANLHNRNAIRVVFDQWCQHLLKAGDRHSVANLIAPFSLPLGLPQERANAAWEQIANDATKQRRALLSILRYTILRERRHGIRSSLLEDIYGQPYGICDRRTKVKFVLVDDHYDLGYHHFLGNILFGNYNPENARETAQLQQAGSATPMWLFRSGDSSLKCFKNLDWLEPCLIGNRQKMAQNRILEKDNPRIPFKDVCDVLFLDLRLWDNVSEGREVMRKLVALAKRLNAHNIDDQEFKRALKAAKAEANSIREEIRPQALALLPLLLSYLDRTLPIILFSSTHQWDVLNMLKHRPNIITHFAKPLISGYGEEIKLHDTVQSLVGAIQEALDLHEARIVWERICALEPKYRNQIGDLGYRFGAIPINGNIVNANDPKGEAYNIPMPLHEEEKATFIRRFMADRFETYLLGKLFYESLSIHWEFLEYEMRKYIRKELCIEEDNKYEINAIPEGHLKDTAKLPFLLRWFRNHKAHGALDREDFLKISRGQVRQSTIFTILLFLFLFDFLEGKTHTLPVERIPLLPGGYSKEMAIDQEGPIIGTLQAKIANTLKFYRGRTGSGDRTFLLSKETFDITKKFLYHRLNRIIERQLAHARHRRWAGAAPEED